MNGEIAGAVGRVEGYTLQNHCHNEEVTVLNGLKRPCPYFDTKPENVPQKLLGAIQTAEEFKELKMLGLLPPLEEISCFEYECYKIAEFAANTIEAERYDEIGSGESNNESPDKIGGEPDESAFSNW